MGGCKYMKIKIARLTALLLSAAALSCCFSLPVFAEETGAETKITAESSEESSSAPVSFDPEGKKIGVTKGSAAAETAGSLKASEVKEYDKTSDAVFSLNRGKLAGVLLDKHMTPVFLEKYKKLTVAEGTVSSQQFSAAVKEDNTELLSEINRAIGDIRKQGISEQLLETYLPAKEGEEGKHYTPVLQKGEALVVAVLPDNSPYYYHQEDTDLGLDREIAYAIADRLGKTVRFEEAASADELKKAVQSGKADIALAGLETSKEAKDGLAYTQPYLTVEQVFLVPKTAAASAAAAVEEENAMPDFLQRLYDNFVKDDRWMYLTKGLWNTLKITFFAMLIGLLAIIRVAYDKNGSVPVLNLIAKLYITIIRGTPAMVQLLIIYYVIFASVNIDKVVVAVIAFGLNSAAYVSEVVRSGIMSIDPGQFEAGKSLGLSFPTTMTKVILPQAFKNVLPALGNEFISLLKETSISGYIGLMDLTRGGDIIRSVTYEAFLPLIAVALIYLFIVVLLSAGVSALEKRLKKNER